ncbi:unnamed protein product [Didymodactylos carnosus]|uniref:DNA-directed RNA polymerase n=1 Tax=Didymodactylos carnosus TaxID=1234261 RepID=A0A814GKX3_9BILA|nr:unnamed protein product [Didymodactylos carnosus]CAF3769392.1 unnamed protein product [Didymodactylos carnosus]
MEDDSSELCGHKQDKTFNQKDGPPIQAMCDITRAHVVSFNWMLKEGLMKATAKLEISKPKSKIIAGASRTNHVVFPFECRMGKCTYSGQLNARLQAEVYGSNGKTIGKDMYDRNLEPIPVMVRPMAMSRGKWRQRGPGFTDKGIQIRCLADDQREIENTLHYLDTGAISFMLRKEMYFIPVIMILKMLAVDNASDREIYGCLMRGCEGNRASEDLMKEAYGFIQLYFALFRFMIRKLFAYVRDECKAEDQDSPSMHELLLPGHVYLALLTYVKLRSSMDAIDKDQIAKAFEFFLATGNLNSKTNVGLRQTSGFSITAERLNILRCISYFRSVHRGDAFTKAKTTSIADDYPSDTNTDLLHSYGMICPANPIGKHLVSQESSYDINVSRPGVPSYLEIVHIPKTGKYTLYPGVYLFTTPARMMRPVRNLQTNTREYISTFEQVYLGICITH